MQNGTDAVGGWAYSSGSRDITVCVVDTGVDFSHPGAHAHAPREQRGARRLRCVPGCADLQANLAFDVNITANQDDNGHGTHISGIIGAVGNNGIGVSGVSQRARILACKALDSTGTGYYSTVTACLQRCMCAESRRGAGVCSKGMESLRPATQARLLISILL